MQSEFRAKVTLFHCINSIGDGETLPKTKDLDYELNAVKLPCSGMATEVFLLKAFEAGVDAVVVMGCLKKECRFAEGSTRAHKRVNATKKILDEIGLDGRRLELHFINQGDTFGAVKIIRETVANLQDLGPNPAVIVEQTQHDEYQPISSAL